jgi:putative effector of murein hydrolase LrgA (UPF0299 family)
MLLGLFVLLACQLAGEAIAHGLHVPVPGPVIGILLLVAIIALRHRFAGRDHSEAEEAVGGTADTLLKHLGLMFVPAGAGIIQSIGLVASNGVAVGVALAGSTIVTLIATVATFRLVSRAIGRRTTGDEA